MVRDWREMTASDFDADAPLTLFDLSFVGVNDVPAKSGPMETPSLFAEEE
jgi:hypothetical protein